MSCWSCGESVVQEARFCRKCGAVLTYDNEATLVRTTPAVVFPTTGRRVVPLTNPSSLESSALHGGRSLAVPSELCDLPQDALPFTFDPRLFSRFCSGAYEPRGLLTLRTSYHDSVKRKVECRHIQLMFARDPTFSGDWKIQADPTSIIRFEDIEGIALNRVHLGFSGGAFTIVLKPERTVRFLEVDEVNRELALMINRKHLRIARRLQLALSYEFAQSRFHDLWST